MPRSATPSCSAGHRSRRSLEDRAARHHQIGALGADAWQGGALGEVLAGEIGADPPHRRGRHDQPVDRRAVVAGRGRDARWRASSPCRWCRAAGDARHPRQRSANGAKLSATSAAHPRISRRATLRTLAGASIFGQRDHAPRRAVPVEHGRHGRPGIDQHQFGRAAANVEDQVPALRPARSAHGSPARRAAPPPRPR
jgi:hypothetical protein